MNSQLHTRVKCNLPIFTEKSQTSYVFSFIRRKKIEKMYLFICESLLSKYGVSCGYIATNRGVEQCMFACSFIWLDYMKRWDVDVDANALFAH